jgi:hypothetical protein
MKRTTSIVLFTLLMLAIWGKMETVVMSFDDAMALTLIACAGCLVLSMDTLRSRAEDKEEVPEFAYDLLEEQMYAVSLDVEQGKWTPPTHDTSKDLFDMMYAKYGEDLYEMDYATVLKMEGK